MTFTVGDVDPALLAEFNCGVRRARHAHETDPFALARLLTTVRDDECYRCHENRHRRCTGHMGHGGRLPCLCEHASHYYPDGAA